MKKILLVLALTFLGAGRAAAQEHTPGHLAAATDLLQLMNVQASVDASIDAMMRIQMEQNPALAPFEQTMRDFFAKYMSWEALRDRYVDLYADTYTEDELKQMAVFYRSPVGQKVARMTPDLLTRSAKLGEETVQAHMSELQQMIMTRVEELQRERGGTRP